QHAVATTIVAGRRGDLDVLGTVVARGAGREGGSVGVHLDGGAAERNPLGVTGPIARRVHDLERVELTRGEVALRVGSEAKDEARIGLADAVDIAVHIDARTL